MGATVGIPEETKERIRKIQEQLGNRSGPHAGYVTQGEVIAYLVDLWESADAAGFIDVTPARAAEVRFVEMGHAPEDET